MIIEELLSRPLTDEVSIVLITLDVYAAMGSDIYFQLPVNLHIILKLTNLKKS